MADEPEIYTVVEAAGIRWIRVRGDDGQPRWALFNDPTGATEATWGELSGLHRYGPAVILGNVLGDGDIGQEYHDLLIKRIYG